MSAARYSEYKDSGVEWLGEVPEHWKVDALKRCAEVRLSNVDKHTVDGQPRVLLCNYMDVYKNERIDSSLDFMAATASHDQIMRLALEVGDVIVTKDSENPKDIGVPSYVSEIVPNLVCGYHLALIRCTEKLSSRYLYYFLKSDIVSAIFEVEATGMTRYALGKYSLENLGVLEPSFREQVSIATFLDRETTKIDALVEEQGKLIALLKEKRQAVISRAVTKGIDQSVPMKDSGIEWLGEVPVHWVINPIKYFVDIRLSNIDKHSVEEQPPVVLCNYVDVYKNELINRSIDFMAATASPQQVVRLTLKAGDVVITKDSEDPKDIGVPAYVIENIPDLVCGYHLALLRPSSHIQGKYLYYLLKTDYAKVTFENESTGMTRYSLGKTSIEGFKTTIPPMKEQSAIVAFLDDVTARLDELSAQATHAIILLKERRIALISAAVTGKIDVRGLVAEEVSA